MVGVNKSEKTLKKRLIIKRKIIKHKLNLLKQGEFLHESALDPITRHLKNIENQIATNKDLETEKPNQAVKEEKKALKDITPPLPPPPTSSFTKNEDEDVFISEGDEDKTEKYQIDEDDVSLVQELLSSSSPSPSTSTTQQRRDSDYTDVVVNDYLDQYKWLPKKYISEMLRDTEDLFDSKYGIRFDNEIESFHIGDTRVFIDDNDIIFNNKRYKGTIGLYELLFKKAPANYTKEDLESYREMLLKSNAYRRYYKANQQVDGSRLPKYKYIISPLISNLRKPLSSSSPRGKLSGKGLSKEVNNNKVDYTYWDNPNELVERLRLLIASQQAGNTGHRNEIVSIIEELREANIIE